MLLQGAEPKSRGVVHVSLPQQTYDRLAAAAASEHRSISNKAAQIITDAIIE